jgi:hypothetical protein
MSDPKPRKIEPARFDIRSIPKKPPAASVRTAPTKDEGSMRKSEIVSRRVIGGPR